MGKMDIPSVPATILYLCSHGRPQRFFLLCLEVASQYFLREHGKNC